MNLITIKNILPGFEVGGAIHALSLGKIFTSVCVTWFAIGDKILSECWKQLLNRVGCILH